jgi:pyrimidine-specific ribonucleoside hydrolase
VEGEIVTDSSAMDPEDDEFWDESDRFEDRDPVGYWRAAVAEAERTGDAVYAEWVRRGGPPPAPGISPTWVAPMVLAVADVGGDPGAAIAVVVAALHEPSLALVITLDDRDGQRARFARHLLDLAGRSDVAVAVGSATAASGEDVPIAGMTPVEVPDQTADLLGAVRSVTGATPHLISWINCGPLTDLSAVLADDPQLVNRLVATVAVGPLAGSASAPGPQVIAPDPTAAARVLHVLRRPDAELRDPRTAFRPMSLPSLITAHPEGFVIASGSRLHEHLAAATGPAWAALLAAHLDRWFAHGHPSSVQFPTLTLADAMGVIFVDDEPERVNVDEGGSVRRDPNGVEVMTTYSVDTPLFHDWLVRQLSVHETTEAGGAELAE